jgi:hypothetical protein
METAERYADGAATADELTEAARRAYELVAHKVGEMSLEDRSIRDSLAATYIDPAREYDCAVWSFCMFGQGVARSVSEYARYCELLRDIYGNPFRSVSFNPTWRTPTAIANATAIYAQHAFDRMPILADALEYAGCDNADVLLHCRGDGPHARGCWVVDLVLGKD